MFGGVGDAFHVLGGFRDMFGRLWGMCVGHILELVWKMFRLFGELWGSNKPLNKNKRKTIDKPTRHVRFSCSLASGSR